MDYRKIAEEVYEGIGKKENLISASHCATRLRLLISDDGMCDKKALEEVEGVKGVFLIGGRLQIVFGISEVSRIYEEFMKVSGLGSSVKEDTRILYAPVAGNVIPREQIPDRTLSMGILGDGVGIEPEAGEVVSPCDGIIAAVTEEKHAIGITGLEGMEILLHLGCDTVLMNGDGFEVFVEEGERVSAGQKLAVFDIEKIRKAGFDPTTALLIANIADYKGMQVVKTGKVERNEKLILVEL